MIAGYILWQSFSEIGSSIRILMLGTPPELDIKKLLEGVRAVEGVVDVHHLHVWATDEQQNALEAQIIVADETGDGADEVRGRIKALARERFDIGHTTLELERLEASCEGDNAKVIGHHVRIAGDGDGGRRHADA